MEMIKEIKKEYRISDNRIWHVKIGRSNFYRENDSSKCIYQETIDSQMNEPGIWCELLEKGPENGPAPPTPVETRGEIKTIKAERNRVSKTCT